MGTLGFILFVELELELELAQAVEEVAVAVVVTVVKCCDGLLEPFKKLLSLDS